MRGGLADSRAHSAILAAYDGAADDAELYEGLLRALSRVGVNKADAIADSVTRIWPAAVATVAQIIHGQVAGAATRRAVNLLFFTNLLARYDQEEAEPAEDAEVEGDME